MKFNSTLAFLLIFVVVVISSGVVSGLTGYTLGYEALEEVTQPRIKSGQKGLRDRAADSVNNQPAIVSEAKILQQVNAVMNRSEDKAIPLDGDKASNSNDSFIESP